MINKLLLYTIFHLNMAYSSIEEDRRPEVVQKCYWPLLNMAEELQSPIGIEACGYTLETINAIDSTWVDKLRELTHAGLVEFIGSGYAQLIGSLVPAEVNAANLRLGNQAYERLLWLKSQIALVNEQAYSAGLVRHYLDAGYWAIVMEWDNPASNHSEWSPEWRYLPQYACGQHGEKIPLIWNNSIAFQKFQRYVHNDMELDEYLDYLAIHLTEERRALSLYGNDVEVFDFRPGRYHTEAALQKRGEWRRIKNLFEQLLSDDRFKLVLPSRVLNLMDELGAGNDLSLESHKQPIPVKKQGKYNITRWAVTGRDDLGINTACYQIYQALKTNAHATDDQWRELCYLWSSDFRTHITESRWRRYCERLEVFKRRLGLTDSVDVDKRSLPDKLEPLAMGKSSRVTRDGRYLVVETDSVRVRFNCRRGLAIDGLWLGRIDGSPLCATLPHGFYDDITLGADWYTGHAILEAFGQPKVTDLNPVEPEVYQFKESGDLMVRGVIATPLGPVSKIYKVSVSGPELELSYAFEWDSIPAGTFRVGNITLNPAAFDRSTLYYRTCNGGADPETFSLSDASVDHGAAVSFLVSASCGIGINSGWVELGDENHCLHVEVDKEVAALIGLLAYREVGDSFFCRLALSAGEMDETCRSNTRPNARHEIKLRFCLGQ